MTIKRISFFSVLFLCVFIVVLVLSVIVSQQKQGIQEHAQTQQTTFTFVNNTNETIWVGAQNNADKTSYALPNNGGWEMPAHTSMNATLAYGWAGRFWGRTGCKFDAQGNGRCETGDCAGRLQCNGAGGELPASLAEFALNQFAGKDFYDVSLVDGSNVPLFINTINSSEPDPITSDGCINRPASSGLSGCISDVNLICPQELQFKNASGQVVGCKSACTAFKTDQYCCLGAYGTEASCVHAAWPVDYAYNIFKKAQPYAYSYAFDDKSSTFTCTNCNYRITFGLPSTGGQPLVNPSSPVAAPTLILTSIPAPTPTPTITPTPSPTPTPTPTITPTPLVPTFNCIGMGTVNCLGTVMPTAVNNPSVIRSTQPPNTISSAPNPTQPNQNPFIQLLAPGILVVVAILGGLYYLKRSS